MGDGVRVVENMTYMTRIEVDTSNFDASKSFKLVLKRNPPGNVVAELGGCREVLFYHHFSPPKTSRYQRYTTLTMTLADAPK